MTETAAAPAACPVCGGVSFAFVLAAPDRQHETKARFSIWRCNRCGVGVTRPEQTAVQRRAAYPESYEPHHTAATPARGWRGRMSAAVLAAMGYRLADAWPLPAFLARPLFKIRGWTWRPPLPPPGRLLDVGCGGGAYGASLLRLGWRVDGIEPNRAAAERAAAAGIQIQACELVDADLPKAAYDVVTLWHVLEHLDDPTGALRQLRPTLKADGRLIVETPNWAGLGANLTRNYWFHLDLPRHRLHFTPPSLQMALVAAGFTVLRLEHIPNPHGLAGAIAYRWRGRKRQGRLLQALGWGFGLLAALLHRGEVLRVVARPVRRSSD